MANIKPLSDIVKKWSDVTPGRSAYYESGIRAPSTDWAGATAAAEGSWADGTAQAAADKRFSKNVSAAGTGKWQANAIAKKGRWPEGVRVGTDAYQAGFEPFRRTIEATTLPPRYPRGDPRNMLSVSSFTDRLLKLLITPGEHYCLIPFQYPPSRIVC
jgi:hypothetical protein